MRPAVLQFIMQSSCEEIGITHIAAYITLLLILQNMCISRQPSAISLAMVKVVKSNHCNHACHKITHGRKYFYNKIKKTDLSTLRLSSGRSGGDGTIIAMAVGGCPGYAGG